MNCNSMRVLLAFLLSVPLLAVEYDWLFRNARVVDGTGNPSFNADVAVINGRIAAVGQLPNAEAGRIIDAMGLVLAPGFIDVHTHIEGTIKQVRHGDNFVFDGVTTVVTGNCGSSKTNLAEFFTELEELGIGLNVASLIGHNSVRAAVFGSRNRAPTTRELALMKDLVAQGMRDGAVGLSTGLIYTPGVYSETEELIELARTVAEFDGVYATHMRDEESGVFEAIEEAIRIGREADLPVEISHFKVNGRRQWGGSERAIAMVERARGQGLQIFVDQYPYDRSSTSLIVTVPNWALSGGREKFGERADDPDTHERIAEEMKRMLADEGQDDYSHAMVAAFGPEPALEGKTITEINQMRGRERTLDNEILTIMEMVRQEAAQMVYHGMSMEDVERILVYENTAVASDGGTRHFRQGRPHPRSYGTNARVLAHFVRERGILTLEDAIRRMTSLPAGTFGFRDRGQIREGMAADLVLFDPNEVETKATYADPHHYSTGFRMVLVNGESVVEEGKITGLYAGRILRHIQHDPTDSSK